MKTNEDIHFEVRQLRKENRELRRQVKDLRQQVDLLNQKSRELAVQALPLQGSSVEEVLKQITKPSQHHSVPRHVLWQLYRGTCTSQRIYPLGRNAFYKAVRDLGYEEKWSRGGGRAFLGMCIPLQVEDDSNQESI